MIWILLVIYQLKHFLADFPFQNKYMLGKFKGGNEWILPLLAHASVHGAMTYLIALMVKPSIAIWLALFDLVVHFVADRIKASPELLGRFKSLSNKEYISCELSLEQNGLSSVIPVDEVRKRIKSNTYFWWALGADQTAHHLTHYFIIWCLV